MFRDSMWHTKCYFAESVTSVQCHHNIYLWLITICLLASRMGCLHKKSGFQLDYLRAPLLSLCCTTMIYSTVAQKWIKRWSRKNSGSVWPEPPMRSLWVGAELQMGAFYHHANHTGVIPWIPTLIIPWSLTMQILTFLIQRECLPWNSVESFMWNKSRINTRRLHETAVNKSK